MERWQYGFLYIGYYGPQGAEKVFELVVTGQGAEIAALEDSTLQTPTLILARLDRLGGEGWLLEARGDAEYSAQGMAPAWMVDKVRELDPTGAMGTYSIYTMRRLVG
ncbi:hypothetical protein ABZ721_29430 [Streptomyces sp. NPDC006733]|uniref:hypothetical protein n=1 Tax=Streptomyces sp. NPDC006733 TaxID=3155460 RepID=UPI0033D56644